MKEFLIEKLKDFGTCCLMIVLISAGLISISYATVSTNNFEMIIEIILFIVFDAAALYIGFRFIKKSIKELLNEK